MEDVPDENDEERAYALLQHLYARMRAEEYRDAMDEAQAIVDAYGDSRNPYLRGCVAVALQTGGVAEAQRAAASVVAAIRTRSVAGSRLAPLWLWLRDEQFSLEQLARHVGPHPEPEVVEALRSVSPLAPGLLPFMVRVCVADEAGERWLHWLNVLVTASVGAALAAWVFGRRRR